MGAWKERLERLGAANAEARMRWLRGLTEGQAIEVLEGLLGNLPHPPREPRSGEGPSSGRKRSLGRLMRR